MIDLDFVYKVSLQKLHTFHRESDGLRKLVLLNNFVFKKLVSPQQEEQIDDDPLEWSEEDIKKDEESWLDSCLNDLDEDEDGYIYVNMPPEYQSTVTSFPINCYDDSRHYEDHYIQNNNSMDYEQQPHEHQLSKDDNIVEDVIIPHDLLHLPYFEPSGEGGPYHMDIEEEQVKPNNTSLNDTSPQHDYDVNMTEVDDYSENLSCGKGFHPYWKDNSIISPSIYPLKKSSPFRPYFELNTRSFGIPKIFHKYRLGQDYSPYHIAPPFIRKLLQSDHSYQSFDAFHYDSPLKRSKDDLDILYSLAPRVIDKGALMDMISMLEYYGCKTNHKKESNSSETSDMWFLDNE